MSPNLEYNQYTNNNANIPNIHQLTNMHQLPNYNNINPLINLNPGVPGFPGFQTPQGLSTGYTNDKNLLLIVQFYEQHLTNFKNIIVQQNIVIENQRQRIVVSKTNKDCRKE